MKTKQAFTVPKVNDVELEWHSRESVLDQLRESKVVMTFFQAADKTFKFLFSGFGEDEFAMLLIILDSHPQLYEFFKAAVVNTELYRIDELQGFRYSQAMIENCIIVRSVNNCI